MYKRPIEKKKIVSNILINKRTICPRCEFIEQRCLCHYLETIHNQTRITILQHPSETKHPLNTAKLLTKSFFNISIFRGEDFSKLSELHQLLEQYKHNQALLFPSPSALQLTNTHNHSEKKINHLVLIDGSWKKAKKIFYTNLFLQRLPTLFLKVEESGQYILRKSNVEGSLSTLEATIIALKNIEPNCETESLKIAFRKMIDYQIERMGQETFENNYKKKEQ